MSNINISEATIALIDSLKSTTGAYGLAGTGSEYKIVTEMFLYKFFNDKFGYEAKRDEVYGERLRTAEKWDAEYDKFTEDEVEDLFSYLPHSVPRMKPEHTLSHLYNSATKGDFSTLLDATLIDIASLNADTFSVTTSGKSKVNIFFPLTTYVTDTQKRDEFAKALMNNVASFNFEDVFGEKYDFFSHIFEYLLKGFNNASGGKYAEYYTPHAIAQVMARLLVGDKSNFRGITCYDPSAGTGTLLMALAHQIGEDNKIVNTFQNKEAVDDFSVAVTYDEIKEKGYSLSAGQYFDIKIDYVDITEEEFNKRMNNYRSTLKAQFEESHRLEEEILKQLDSINFNENVWKEHDNE